MYQSKSNRVWAVVLGILRTLITEQVHAQSEYRYAVLPLPTLGGEHSYGWSLN